MLSLSMGLDSDLGIDSIKRVEIFSALAEKIPGLPAVGPEHLGAFTTLAEVVDFLAGAEAAPVSAGHGTETVADALLAVVADLTGYPAEMLSLSMGLDTDLGIDSIKRVEIFSALAEKIPGLPAVGPEHLGAFTTLAEVVDFLAGAEAAPVSAGHGTETVADALLAVVADLTGYPAEMLSLSMGLDTDLGIDSIKRVEIFSALAEKIPGLPAVGPEHLGAFATLAEVVDFLASGPAAPVAEDAAPPDELGRALLTATARVTGYPEETLSLDQDLETDLGLDPVRLAEIIDQVLAAHPGLPPIGPEILAEARTLRQAAEYLRRQTAATPDQSPSSVAQGRPIKLVLEPVSLPESEPGDASFQPRPGGLVLVTDDGSELAELLSNSLREKGWDARVHNPSETNDPDLPPNLAGLILLADAGGATQESIVSAFQLVKQAGPLLRQAGEGGALLAAVTRLDGRLGLAQDMAPGDPASAGLAGLVKTAGHEWPEVTARVIDLAPDLPRDEAARLLGEELFRAGPQEVGLSAEGRTALELRPAPVEALPAELPLSPGDVVVVSGGARGVTAEAALALAKAARPVLVILGRSPAPEDEPDWLKNLTGEAAVKKALLVRSGSPLTPKELEAEYRKTAANREVLINLARFEAAGATVMYRSVDVRDPAAVAAALGEIRVLAGPVKGLIHGAGVLADGLIADKTADQFDLVYSVKVQGLASLLAAVGRDELKFLALFSSSTGRFGRQGQADYAAANEVLNKTAQAQARKRPGCRAVSFNWGPWDGGMVTRSLKKLFQDEGLGLIPLEEGARFFLEELMSAPGGPVELVVLGPGSDIASLAPAIQVQSDPTVTLEISVDQMPVLAAHVIDGQAVAPMALMMEWLGAAGKKAAPHLAFRGLDRLKVHSRLSLDRAEAIRLRVERDEPRTNGESSIIVPVRLVGPGNGQGRIMAEALAVLADDLLPAEPLLVPTGEGDRPGAPENYGPSRLFHGPALQGLEGVRFHADDLVSARCRPAPAPEAWLIDPPGAWLADPLIIDGAFQLVTLWSIERAGAPALPIEFDQYRQFRAAFPKETLRLAARIIDRRDPFILADIEVTDARGSLIASFKGLKAAASPSLVQAFARNRLEPLESGLNLAPA